MKTVEEGPVYISCTLISRSSGNTCSASVSLQNPLAFMGCGILADEVPGDAVRVGAGQGPEAAILLGGILQGPPQPDHRRRVCAQEGAVLVRPHLPAYLGLLRSHLATSSQVAQTVTLPGSGAQAWLC